MYSQITNTYIGYLTTTTKDIITYQIDFELKTDNSINGESTTDIYGKNKTKSFIKGNYNSDKKIYSFKEINNTTTKSASSKDEFCFIECEELKLKTLGGKEVLVGKFIGRYPNGESCAQGSIYLTNKNVLEKEKINFSTIDSLLKNKLEYKSITTKNAISIAWKSKSINFFVWDGSNEDNDVISIYFNDKLIKENLSIKNKKEHIEIPLKKEGKGIVKIKAVSSGKEGKNTVNILFVDDTNFHPYISILELGESISVELK
jgi:hypothetical protein